MTVQVDILPLIVAIEEASGLTWDYITENNVTEWLDFYREEVEEMNKTYINRNLKLWKKI